MDIARKSTSWTLQERQLRGHCEEVNFMESVKKTTSWTLRGSQLYGKCEEDNFMDMMRKMTSQMQREKCPCRHSKRHDLWEGVGRKK